MGYIRLAQDLLFRISTHSPFLGFVPRASSLLSASISVFLSLSLTIRIEALITCFPTDYSAACSLPIKPSGHKFN
jgi:hypothetical protein